MSSSFQKTRAGSRLACAPLLALLMLALGAPAAVAQETSEEDVPATEQTAPVSEAVGETPTEAVDETANEPPASWDVSNPCENVQHPYQAEVCQQARAAEASESTARLARLIMLIGLVALLILILMLWPIVAAAFAARRAANASSSAPARLAPTPKSADREAELRAYVDVDSLEFVETPEADSVVKVKLTLRNSGQTPAFKLESTAEMEIVDGGNAELTVRPVPDDAPLSSSRPRVGRDATAAIIVECPSSPKLAEQVTGGAATILVWGAASYYDVFDHRRRTVFQYFCNAETLETGEMFRPTERGDEIG